MKNLIGILTLTLLTGCSIEPEVCSTLEREGYTNCEVVGTAIIEHGCEGVALLVNATDPRGTRKSLNFCCDSDTTNCTMER